MYNRALRRILISILLTVFTINSHGQDIEQVIKAKPFSWTGSLGAGTEFYTTNAPLARYSPFAWQMNGNFSMTLYETITLPFSFTIGNQVKGYNLPYFQMGMSPSYKWATLHVGYRNLSFSPYGLNGATFLGTGIELNPKLLRFGAMFGRFNKANDADTTDAIFSIPAYKRLGYGGKIGVGTDNNFVDFSFFGAKDDTNSIERPLPLYNIAPQENMVFGVSTKQLLFNKLTLTGDYGLSFLTNDLQGDAGESKAPFKGNSTTRTYHAIKTSLGYQLNNANLMLSYERVDEGYRSLGSYFFNDDFEQILFSPSWSMIQNKVFVNLSLGMQRNNLDKSEGIQDFRWANSISLNINPSQKFGISADYSNFSMNQRAINNFDINDTFRIINITNNLNVSPRFTFASETKVQSIILNYNFQIFNDKNIVNSEFAGNTSHFTNLSYNLNLISSMWNIFAGLNFNMFEQSISNLKQAGATAGFSKSFLDNQLNTSFNTTYNLSVLNNSIDGGVVALNLNAGYTLVQKHTFSLNTSFLNISSKTNQSFYELRGGIRYNFTIR